MKAKAAKALEMDNNLAIAKDILNLNDDLEESDTDEVLYSTTETTSFTTSATEDINTVGTSSLDNRATKKIKIIGLTESSNEGSRSSK